MKIIPQRGNLKVLLHILVMTEMWGGNHSTSHLSDKDLFFVFLFLFFVYVFFVCLSFSFSR